MSIKLRDILKEEELSNLHPHCSTEELGCSQIRASRSGRDLTLKESEVTGGEYEMSLEFWSGVLAGRAASRANGTTNMSEQQPQVKLFSALKERRARGAQSARKYRRLAACTT